MSYVSLIYVAKNVTENLAPISRGRSLPRCGHIGHVYNKIIAMGAHSGVCVGISVYTVMDAHDYNNNTQIYT